MIVRKFEDILPSPLAVHTDTWSSFRLLTRDDGLGFSLHETWIQPGTQTHIWYKHHYEAVYCLEGEGEIEPVDADGHGSGQPVAIKPGVMYALNQHDRHFLRARSRLRLICVFSPPLRGDERHGADGAYPAPEAVAQPLAAAKDRSAGMTASTLTSATPRASTPPPQATAATLAEVGKAARVDPAAGRPVSIAPTATAARLAAAHPAQTVNKTATPAATGPVPVTPGQGLDHLNGDSADDGEEESP